MRKISRIHFLVRETKQVWIDLNNCPKFKFIQFYNLKLRCQIKTLLWISGLKLFIINIKLGSSWILIIWLLQNIFLRFTMINNHWLYKIVWNFIILRAVERRNKIQFWALLFKLGDASYKRLSQSSMRMFYTENIREYIKLYEDKEYVN